MVKASELIELLQECIVEFGDLDVVKATQYNIDRTLENAEIDKCKFEQEEETRWNVFTLYSKGE